MAEPRIHALSALLGGCGFIGGLAVVLVLCLRYPNEPKGRVIFPGIAGGWVYLLLVTLVPSAERVLPVVSPPLGVVVGMLSLFTGCVLRDAARRWRQRPGYGVRIPGQGIVSGPFATMDEAQRHVYQRDARVVPYNPWRNPSSMRYLLIGWIVLGLLISVSYIMD